MVKKKKRLLFYFAHPVCGDFEVLELVRGRHWQKVVHLVHLPQERPVARALHRGEVVDVPPEVVVRREPRRRELRLERRVVELETREPAGEGTFPRPF